MPSRDAEHANFTIFGLTRTEIEPMIYRTRCEHTNHYTMDVIGRFYFIFGVLTPLSAIFQLYYGDQF